MKNRSTGFTFGDETQEILDSMKARDIPKSATIRNLLRAFRDNGYQIPVLDSRFPEVDEEHDPEPAI